METNGYAPLSNKNEDTIALLSEEPVINSGSEETTTPSETKLPYSDIQKEPPPYDAPYYSASTSKEVIPQLEPVGTTNNQSLAVNTVVVQQQPHFDTLPTISPVSEAVADQTFGLSIFCCFFCCLCGSPLTLLCFIPAIVLSLNVSVCYLYCMKLKGIMYITQPDFSCLKEK